MSLRVLARGDEAALDGFLAAHADSSMFLRSNLRSAGIVYHGAPLEAVYVACFTHGRLAGVVAHCWNGIVLIQAGEQIDALIAALVDISGRPVTGIVGPLTQVRAARSTLGMSEAACQIDSTEELYALALGELVVPLALYGGRARCRRPELAEVPLLAEWRYAYSVEALNSQPGAALQRRCEKEVELLPLDWQFMLVDGDEIAAYAAFNAALPEVVQIGGVWTPPARRGRGYGRAVVAGALLAARDAVCDAPSSSPASTTSLPSAPMPPWTSGASVIGRSSCSRIRREPRRSEIAATAVALPIAIARRLGPLGAADLTRRRRLARLRLLSRRFRRRRRRREALLVSHAYDMRLPPGLAKA